MGPEWRAAVRLAMWEAAEEEATQSNGGAAPAYNYRWEHVTTVVTLALKLARMLGADEDVVEAAAWLHDITKRDGELHAQSGADYARRFLPATDFPPEKVDRVAQAINEHIGLYRDEPLTNLESMILWDADKLSKIGLTAAFHWTGMAMSQEARVTTADLIAKREHNKWQSKTVASLHTEPARRAAKSRNEAFNQLWDELEAELKGEDLR